MKIRVLALVLFCLSDLVVYAQPFDLKPEIERRMAIADYDTAAELMQLALGWNQKDADLWMLNATLLIQKFAYNQPRVGGNIPDENIFDLQHAFVGEGQVILPKTIADSALSCLNAAEQLSKKQAEIQKGKAYIYAVSLQTKNLILMLHRMHALLDDGESKTMQLAPYARLIADRGALQDAMQVYAGIASLFQDDAAILGEMAEVYFENGDMKTAITYATMAINKLNTDSTVFENAFIIYALNEQYTQALSALQKKYALIRSREYLIYEALQQPELTKYAKVKLQEFLKSPVADAKLKELATRLISPGFKGSKIQYDSLLDSDIDDVYLLALIKWYQKKYPEENAPSLKATEIYTYHKMYEQALNEITRLNPNTLKNEEPIIYHLYAGWVYYKLGNLDEAAYHFSELTGGLDPLLESTALYFLGVINEKNGLTQDAISFYRQTIELPTQSENKFQRLAAWQLNRITGK